MGKTSAVKHRISLIDETPFTERSRPIAARDLNDARKHIQDLLDSDIIHPSNSPYASAIVLVRKKNGSLRLSVDFRKLNKRIIKDAYSLPRIDDSFARLSGARWFSVMDLKDVVTPYTHISEASRYIILYTIILTFDGICTIS